MIFIDFKEIIICIKFGYVVVGILLFFVFNECRCYDCNCSWDYRLRLEVVFYSFCVRWMVGIYCLLLV